MSGNVEMIVTRENGTITFSFPAGPVRFVTFVITSSTGEELWQLHPVGMRQAERSETGGRFMAIPLRDNYQQNAAELVGRLAAEHPSISPPVEKIEYATVPAGYHEDEPAKPLAHGVTYKAILLNVPEYATIEFTA